MHAFNDFIVFFGLIALGLILVVGGTYFVWVLPRQRRRTAALAREATMMGFTLEAESKREPREVFGPFQLFKVPRAGAMTNVIRGELAGGTPLQVFDFEYSAHPDSDVRQTVAAISLPGGQLPVFSLQAKPKERVSLRAFRRIGLRVADMMSGYRKIDFPHHGRFNAGYRLRSPEPAANFRGLFDDGLLSFFAENPGWQVEGRGEGLILYGHDKLLRPQDLRDFVGECGKILAQFTCRSPG